MPVSMRCDRFLFSFSLINIFTSLITDYLKTLYVKKIRVNLFFDPDNE